MRPGTQFPYEDLFQSDPDGLVVIDRSGHIARVNRRAEMMFGCGPGESIGRSPESLLTDHGRAAYAHLLTAAPGVPVELATRGDSEASFVVEATLAHLGIPGELALLALRDVTARKQDEEMLRARARQQGLVAELGRRALTGIDLDHLMGEAVTLVLPLRIKPVGSAPTATENNGEKASADRGRRAACA